MTSDTYQRSEDPLQTGRSRAWVQESLQASDDDDDNASEYEDDGDEVKPREPSTIEKEGDDSDERPVDTST